MKIAHSAASPYVRKVMACAIARGLNDKIERMKIGTTDPALLAYNPLSKVPTLITDDGASLYDSPVICEYIASLGTGPVLIPAAGSARFAVLRLQALTDGMTDSLVIRRVEGMRPEEDARKAWIEVHRLNIVRGLDWLEQNVPGTALDLGSISVVCMLGFLDFRFAADAWRTGRPNLSAWYDAILREPALARTVPREPT